MRRTTITGLGGLVAAFLGSLCCVGPLLLVTFGVGAGLASTFEPLRPLFGVLMTALLALGFWTVYGPRSMQAGAATAADATTARGNVTCASNDACTRPTRRSLDVIILWSATLLALVFWTFPTWSRWLV